VPCRLYPLEWLRAQGVQWLAQLDHDVLGGLRPEATRLGEALTAGRRRGHPPGPGGVPCAGLDAGRADHPRPAPRPARIGRAGLRSRSCRVLARPSPGATVPTSSPRARARLRHRDDPAHASCPISVGMVNGVVVVLRGGQQARHPWLRGALWYPPDPAGVQLRHPVCCFLCLLRCRQCVLASVNSPDARQSANRRAAVGATVATGGANALASSCFSPRTAVGGAAR
jgi:hypothetical protein